MNKVKCLLATLAAVGAVYIPYLWITYEGSDNTNVLATLPSPSTPQTGLPTPNTATTVNINDDEQGVIKQPRTDPSVPEIAIVAVSGDQDRRQEPPTPPTRLSPEATMLENMIIEHQKNKLLSSREATASPFR